MPEPPVLFVVGDAESDRRGRLERRCADAASSHGLGPRFLERPRGAQDWRDRIVTEVRSAVDEGARLVVAVGGDGTIGAAAQGLWGTQAALGVVPTGAANLFARSLSIPFDLDSALEAAFLGRTRAVDLAVADGRAVVAMAGIGVDAAVVASTTTASKEALGWASYGLATLPHLFDRPRRFELRLDGGRATKVEAQSVIVANTGQLPAGLALSPMARADDGLLDVAVLAPRGPLGWLVLLFEMAQSGHLPVAAGRPGPLQARSVAISAEAALPRQVDGEALPPGRELAVQVLEAALSVRVPLAPPRQRP